MHVEGFEHGETKSQLIGFAGGLTLFTVITEQMKLPTGASEADGLSRALAYIFNTCTNLSPFSLGSLF